jgi:hypothetical protein
MSRAGEGTDMSRRAKADETRRGALTRMGRRRVAAGRSELAKEPK